MELNYPERAHPHGVAGTKPNKYRIWVCEECLHVFTDEEIRQDELPGLHPCKCHPQRKGQRCESHLEPYVPKKNRRAR